MVHFRGIFVGRFLGCFSCILLAGWKNDTNMYKCVRGRGGAVGG